MRTSLLTGCLWMGLAVLCAGASAAETQRLLFYVSTEGNDAWSGTVSRPNAGKTDGPFATVERARDALRAAWRNRPGARGTVKFMGGRYHLEQGLEFVAEDSGTADAPAVYEAEAGQEVHLVGGRPVSGFAAVEAEAILNRLAPEARGKVVQADLKAQGITNLGQMKSRGFGRPTTPAGMELFFRNEPMTLARWPNRDYVKIAGFPNEQGFKDEHGGQMGKLAGGFTYDGDRPKGWKDPAELWVHGFWAWDWANSYEKVESLDTTTRTIKTAPPHGLYGFRKGQRFYFLNVLEELDEAGEWFVDRKKGILYFWPPSPIEAGSVIVSTLEKPIIHLSRSSNVTIRGLILEGTRGNAIEIDYGSNVRVEGCTIRNIGDYGVVIRNGTGHTVADCQISQTGDGGVNVSGGDRNTLTACGHTIHNNHLHHIARWSRCYSPAILMSGVGIRVSNNLIHDHPHCAILFNGNEHVIELNEIHHVCMDTGDVGAIYTGRDYSYRGNIIRHNYIHETGGVGMGSMGVYMDDCVSGTTIVGNIFWKVHRAVFLGGGRDFKVENNVFVECKPGVELDGRGLSKSPVWHNMVYDFMKKRLEDVNWKQPPYRARYPDMAALEKYYATDDGVPPGNITVARNISVDGPFFVAQWGATKDMAQVKDNLVDQDPHFVDRAKGNFQVRADSPAFKLGFQRIPVEKIGLQSRDEPRAGELAPEAPDGPVIAEAEDFWPADGSAWKAKKWGENYYAATIANTFLSRKAFLGAPEQCESSSATSIVRIREPGKHLALVRYEAVPRFETQFRLKIEQNGKVKLDRLYGARENVKIWAFGQKLKKEVFWSWGAVENMVWEGHDAAVDLDVGEARLTISAEKQPIPGARRNVDVILLTKDVDDVARRMDKENYLPLDGLLTQTGDVYARVMNTSGRAVTITIPNGIEHSPYWVHMRKWEARKITAQPGQITEWMEVGSLLDTLNDGQWRINAKGEGALRYALEFAVRGDDGRLERIGRFEDLSGDVELAYFADTRKCRKITTTEQLLYDLVDYLKANPVSGKAPTKTLIYGYTFDPRPRNARYMAALEEFASLMGTTALNASRGSALGKSDLIRGYIDLRDKSPEQLREAVAKLKSEGVAEKIAVVSLGDEIGLQQPGKKDAGAFHEFLKARGLRPADVVAGATEWSQAEYRSDADRAAQPAMFYYSHLFRYAYGIARQKELTDALRDGLPNAGIGANLAPHHGHPYLGAVHQWIDLFRSGGMTMPWSEDYVWQMPIGTQQMNFISLDLFRCALRKNSEGKIHFYVMPHWPGNTPASWRRQFYGAIGHGAKILNLFEFRPVQASYTENHVSLPEMYQEVRRGLYELGRFEDIVQAGKVRRGTAALWFSQTSDIWDDQRSPFDAAKRCLYIAIRHQQLPLDVITDEDAIAGELSKYQVLYLTDAHVTQAGTKAIAQWVQAGGELFVTAGAGAFDELNRPNQVMTDLVGCTQKNAQQANEPVRFEKQDLPFAAVMDSVKLPGGTAPVVNVRAEMKVAQGVEVVGRFPDGQPAVVHRQHGKGTVTTCAFLPGLSYFKPAIPMRPADRGTTDTSMAHFIPTEFDRAAGELIGMPAKDVERPVVCSNPLVETTIIDSPRGSAVVLINWSGGPVQRLEVRLNDSIKHAKVERASGLPVERTSGTCRLDLDVADALILRP